MLRLSLLSFAASAHAYSTGAAVRGVRSRAGLLRASDAAFDGVKPSTVFMFPGQGAQAVGMGVEVRERDEANACVCVKQ